jgi:diguanylate cyclase (GGDEF)-like protein
MFNLSRYFSTVSFILIVMAAGVLGPLYRWLSAEQMTELAEHRNVAMAQVFENSLHDPLEALMRASLGQNVDFLRQSSEAELLRKRAIELLRNTSMVKVKIYNRLGITVFSSDPAQLGENQLENAGFRSAMRGEVASQLTHRNSMDSFDGVRANIDLLSSYVPIIGQDQSNEGVFELYQDVTPFMVQLQRGQWWVTAGVFAVFSMLYFMQFVVVRRAQRILMEQEGRIIAACDTLELQVDARTAELKRSNSLLKGEISERLHAESKLNYLAYHDPLTGLANRRCFMERLEQSLHEAGQCHEQVAVLFIDLDQFKQVNDSLGHGIGDELLVSVAARLSEHVRLIDMLARLGGDEFICLMEGVRSDDELVILAREIISAFEHSFRLGEHELFLSASVGISRFPEDAQSVVDLMRNADTAMYRAKAAGRGQFHFYTPEMTRDAQARIQMENLLRRALVSGELAVHFQPQVDTLTGRLIGAEALLRWHSPELGEVMPACFIPLAEDSGIIIALGNWVLRETCRQVMQWRRSGFELAQVSVNLSVKQLERPEFFTTLGDILDETGMDASCLKLELTESVVMKVGTEAFRLLQRLRDFGISLALDDFGTGYSSLSYLKELPVQQLKIDQSFVMGIGQNAGDEAIIRTVMELAGSLGLEVIAEGVETYDQSAFLAKLGCQQLQGYLHGRAVSSDEFRAIWAFLQ